MKRVLIVSPRFPPVDMPEIHRVRHSLPYLRQFGWEATTLAIDPELVDGYRDENLLATVPDDADVRFVEALHPGWTRWLGLNNPALRSLWHYRDAGDALLATGRYDLVYFTTTLYAVASLGPRWKRRFGVPFVVDMQDPWRSDHYLTLPRNERPPKFWLAYQIDRLLEARTMAHVDGIVAVSQSYCDVLQARYSNVLPERCRVIPFGGPAADFEALDAIQVRNAHFDPQDGNLHVVYVGAGGHQMRRTTRALFGALRRGLDAQPERFERVRLHFIGTDYAPAGTGTPTFKPIANEMGVGAYVDEQTDRVPYFTALHLIREAHMTVLPGSVYPAYTASKLYPYILSRTPLLAIFHSGSSVVDVLGETGAGATVAFDDETSDADLEDRVLATWSGMLERLPYVPNTDWEAFEPYTAREMTRRQSAFFDEIVAHAAR
jgi:hypothetical protein